MPNINPNLLFAYLNGCNKMLKETTFKSKMSRTQPKLQPFIKVILEFFSPHIICILLPPITPKVTPNHQMLW
jgi:hypothetical protein